MTASNRAVTARGVVMALLTGAAGPGVWAQSARPEPRLEVASVRRSAPGGGASVEGGPGTSSPNRFTARNRSFVLLAMQAYGVEQTFQVECRLPWMTEEHYDVIANVPPGATREEFQVMLQRLLQERFGLGARRETRPMRGYRLVVAKGGARLPKAAERPNASSGIPGVVVRGGVPDFSLSSGSGELMTLEAITLRGRSQTLKWLASRLSGRLKVPVIDATSLEGEYDFTLTYAVSPEVVGSGTGRFAAVGPPPSGPEPAGAAAPSLQPTLWDAMQRQLGLRLEAVENVPVEVVILEKGNKDPIEN